MAYLLHVEQGTGNYMLIRVWRCWKQQEALEYVDRGEI